MYDISAITVIQSPVVELNAFLRVRPGTTATTDTVHIVLST